MKIVVIGVPGSGKSTFALKLGKKLGLPVLSLDNAVFLSNGDKRDKAEVLQIQQEMMSREGWIIEGCAISSLDMRYPEADLVIDFKFSRWLCIWRVFKRKFFFDPALVESGCLPSVNRELLRYIWTFDQQKRKQIDQVRERYPAVQYTVFSTSSQADRWLSSIECRQN